MSIKIDFSDRLKLSLKGESEHGFSKRANISSTVMRRYISGETLPGLDNLIKIAEAAGVSVEWLATGKEQKAQKSLSTLNDHGQEPLYGSTMLAKSEAAQGREPMDTSNWVNIPIINMSASAGGGTVVNQESRSGIIQFDKAWLHQHYRLNPNELYLMPSAGESMEPTIRAGELLLCSHAEHHLQYSDGIYIIRIDDNVFVKRLQFMPGGKVEVSSDNTAYKPYTIDLKDESIDFTLVGRVVLILNMRSI